MRVGRSRQRALAAVCRVFHECVQITPCATPPQALASRLCEATSSASASRKPGRSDADPSDEIADDDGSHMQVHEFQDGLRRRREELSGASLAEEAWSMKVVKACLAGLLEQRPWLRNHR